MQTQADGTTGTGKTDPRQAGGKSGTDGARHGGTPTGKQAPEAPSIEERSMEDGTNGDPGRHGGGRHGGGRHGDGRPSIPAQPTPNGKTGCNLKKKKNY